MKKLIPLLFTFSLLTSCQKDAFLSISAGSNMTDFLPTVTRSFASHSGDTIQLELLESSNTISTLDANEAQSDKGFDYIETDNYEYLYGNDSIDILFDYALKTEYDASLENLTKGLLNI